MDISNDLVEAAKECLIGVFSALVPQDNVDVVSK